VRREYARGLIGSGRIPEHEYDKLLESDAFFFGSVASDLANDCRVVAGEGLRGLYSMGKYMGKALRKSARVMYSSFFDEKYIDGIMNSILERVDEWETSGRIGHEKAEKLRQSSRSETMREYVKGFGAHAALKSLDPPLVGDALWLSLSFGYSPLFMIPYSVSPIMRTAYTASRIVKNRGKGFKYGKALCYGMTPKAGVLAFPLQMSDEDPEFGDFLMQLAASEIGDIIPIWGGQDSVLQHRLMQASDSLFIDVKYIKTRQKGHIRRA
jgi:hypothetical protein